MKRPSDLLTVRTVAEEKGVHPKSVYRAIANDRLIAERQGDTVLVRRREMDKWSAVKGRPRKQQDDNE